jgi:hypothetical protein
VEVEIWHTDNYVRIFDTTLRDGEQSPGATLTSGEKLEIAHALARLGVDVMEAGFPAASPDDLEAVRRIAVEVGNRSPLPGREPPIICGPGAGDARRHRQGLGGGAAMPPARASTPSSPPPRST